MGKDALICVSWTVAGLSTLVSRFYCFIHLGGHCVCCTLEADRTYVYILSVCFDRMRRKRVVLTTT